MPATTFGSSQTQQQANASVQADIARGEWEYRRAVLEDTKWYDNEIEPAEAK